MKYTHSIPMSVQHPGLIVIMVDQSGSMYTGYTERPEKLSRAEFASKAVNQVIYEVLNANMQGGRVQNRCHLQVIGYGESVAVLVDGQLSEIARQPKKIERNKTLSQDGSLVKYRPAPHWIDPVSEGGTPMGRAFESAQATVDSWISSYPNSAAPLIINITDGQPNSQSNTQLAAEQLMQTTCKDGPVLVFNVHIADPTEAKVLLPDDIHTLADSYAKFLFGISSTIPESMFPAAKSLGLNPTIGSRGMVYNANAETLVKLLNFSISKTRILPSY